MTLQRWREVLLRSARTLSPWRRAWVFAVLLVCGFNYSCSRYYFRWNAREPAVAGSGDQRLQRHADPSDSARQSVAEGDYVQLRITDICFPSDPDNLLGGSLVDPGAARLSFMIFVGSETAANTWSDIEQLTGRDLPPAVRREFLSRYRVFPYLHYTSPGTCVRQTIISDWIPVDSTGQLPQVSMAAMLMTRDEVERMGSGVREVTTVLANQALPDQLAQTVSFFRTAVSAASDILSAIVENRMILWFSTRVDELASRTEAAPSAALSLPADTAGHFVVFANAQRATDAVEYRDPIYPVRQSDLAHAIATGQVRWHPDSRQLYWTPPNEAEQPYPEPYVRFEVHVRRSRPTPDFWARIEEVLGTLGSGAPAESNRASLLALQEQYAEDRGVTGATVASSSLRLLSTAHSAYLRDWLLMARRAQGVLVPDGSPYAAPSGPQACALFDEASSLLARTTEHERWGSSNAALAALQRLRDSVAQRAQNCDAARTAACGGAPTLALNRAVEGNTFGVRSRMSLVGDVVAGDRFYRIEPPAPGTLDVLVRGTNGYQPTAALLASDCSAIPVAVATPVGASDSWHLLRGSVGADPMFLVIDGQATGQRGAFVVETQYWPGGERHCGAGSTELRTGATVPGRLRAELPSIPSRCARFPRVGDSVFEFTVANDSVVEVQLDAAFDGYLSLRRCDADETELACADDDLAAEQPLRTSTLDLPLAAGRYCVHVSAISERLEAPPSRDFRLSARASARPGLCQAPAELGPGQRLRVVLPAGQGNLRGDCEAGTPEGREIVLAVNIPDDGLYEFWAAPHEGRGDPVLYLLTECPTGEGTQRTVLCSCGCQPPIRRESRTAGAGCEVAGKRGLMHGRAAFIGVMLAGAEGGAGLGTSMRAAPSPAA